MFGLFKRTPVVDEATAGSLFEIYAWALTHLGADLFYRETRLIEPTPAFFPGRAESVHALAGLMFERVQAYAGLAHWPTELVPPHGIDPGAPRRLMLQGPLRTLSPTAAPDVPRHGRLAVAYDPNLVNNPEAMISAFAHTFALYLTALTPEPPPGGDEARVQVAEVVAVFLGFGIMLANTASAVRIRSCGACGPAAERDSSLSQQELTAALALFTLLRNDPPATPLRHLKSHLRPFFKQALKDLGSYGEPVARLRAMTGRPRVIGAGES